MGVQVRYLFGQMERKEITLEMSIMDLMTLMCEGNPGALTVIIEIMKREDGFLYLCHLDDMNVRGSQIWIGFKYHCGQDVNRFIECIKHRDEDMIAKINEMNQGQGDCWKAVARHNWHNNNRPKFGDSHGNDERGNV